MQRESTRRAPKFRLARRTKQAKDRPGHAAPHPLDALPGLLAWVGLFGAVVGSFALPLIVLWGAAALGAYTALRFAVAAWANWRGWQLMRQLDARTIADWRAIYQRERDASSLSRDAVQHVVIIPNYQEPLALLRRTLTHLSQQEDAAEAVHVVLAMEASDLDALEKGAALQGEFSEAFAALYVVTHPSGLHGEMRCKSANQAWAGRWVRRTLVDGLGYDLDHLLVTSMDADTVWHPAYFAALRTLYALDPARDRTFWQAPIRYAGNVWQTQPLLRPLHAYAAAWELAYLSAPGWIPLPMSSYSISLRLLHQTGYWDPDVIADEWHMYLKAYFEGGGALRLQPIYLPFAAHAVTGRGGLGGLWSSLHARYQQTLRHAWGAKEITYALVSAAQQRSIPAWKRARLVWRVSHDNLLAGFGWLFVMAGAQLPPLLHTDLLDQPAAMAPLLTLQIGGLLITLVSLWFWGLDVRLRPLPLNGSRWRAALIELVSLPLLAIIMVGCVALPVLHAQTRLIFGLPLDFRVSAK